MINGSDFSENLQRCHDYIKALEVERRKIQVFGRELPLSLELVTRAIETCKQQLSSGTITSEHNLHGQLSECSEHTSPNVPFFEEFIPMKKASSDSDDEEHESTGVCDKDVKKINDKYCKKSDWLRSVQLWNQTPDPDPKDSIKEEKSMVCDVTATPPTPVDGAAPPPPTSPTAESGGGKKKDEKESRRKSRRCWSPELHRRFLQALQRLGGSHVATPKQIRELMKVDGLSNDEVKSHLQKYRLHTRRPSASTNNNAQTPQFVVMGGIWVPSEYAAMAKTTTSTEATSVAATSNKIYAPIAAPPPPLLKQRQHIKPSSQSDERGSNSRGATQSCSPATSSSTHTTTISPAC